MALHVKRKFVSSRVEDLTIFGKTSITALLERANMPEVIHDYIRVSIDGVVITKEEWANTHADNNNVVFVGLVPQGSDSGKNPIAMIAMLALSVFTAGLSTSVMMVNAFGTSMAGAVSAGIMFVGSLVINALFPPSLPSNKSGTDDSAGFLSFQGQKNVARPGGAVRDIFGTYRVAPDLAVEPYVITNKDVQTIFAIYDFGYGEVDVSEILIGNTKIDSYKGVNYKVHKNYTNEALSYYENDNSTETFSSEITNVEAVERTSPSNETDKLNVDISFPLGLSYYKDGELRLNSAGFTVQIKETNETEWQSVSSIADFSSSHSIVWEDDVAERLFFSDLYDVVDPTLESGYIQMTSKQAFTVQVRSLPYTVTEPYSDARTPDVMAPRVSPRIRPAGALPFLLKDQLFTIDGIRFIIDEDPVSTGTGEYCVYITEGDRNTPWQKSCYNYETWTIHVDKATPVGDKIKNKYTFVENVESEFFGSVAVYGWKPDPALDSPYQLTTVPSTSFVISRATAKPFTLTLNFSVPYRGAWDVSLQRTDAPRYTIADDRYSFVDKTMYAALQSITRRQPLQFTTPHTILELKIQATDQLSGTVDTLSALAKRILPIWDEINGWGRGPTSNLAFMALEVLRGAGNPDPLPDERIDITAYQNWSKFCATLDAETGQEKYHGDFTWDAISTVYERLQILWSAGRATYASIENKHSVIWESFPTLPSQLITPHNSWGFKGRKTFTKKIHGLNVSYIDPESEWQKVTIIVYADGYAEVADPENDIEAGIYFENIDLPLCTRSEQAYRDGRYFLAQGILRPESFTVNVDIEGLACERGNMVEVQHDVARMGGLATRVTGINGTEITLREPVGCTGVQCKLRMRFRNNTQKIENVTNYVTPYTIELETLPPELEVDDLVVFGEENLVTDQFLVKSVMRGKDLTATIDMVPIAYDIQYADTGPIPDYNPTLSNNEMPIPVCLVGIEVDLKLTYLARYPYITATIKWNGVGSGVSYEIWHSADNQGNYSYVTTVRDTTEYVLVNHKSTLDRDYNTDTDQFIKVIPVNVWGNKPTFDECMGTAFRLFRDTTKPGKPLFMAGNVNSDTMNLTWKPPADNDIAGYILKFSSKVDNPRWDEVTAHGSFIPYGATAEIINARIGSYMMKSVDTSGNYSDDYAIVRTSIPSLRGFIDFDDLHEQDNNFDGFKSDVEIVTQDVDVDGVPTSFTGLAIIKPEAGMGYASYGIYSYKKIINLGDIYNCYISNDIKRKIIVIDPLLESHEKYADVVVEMRISSHNPSVSEWDYDFDPILYPLNVASVDPVGGANDNTWSGWQPLYAGYYTGRYFEFRAVLTSIDTNVSPLVYELNVKFEMVERLDAQYDIDATTAPLPVLFVQEFKETPSILITEDNATESGYFTITDKSKSGFTIQFFTANGTPRIAQFDYIAKGFGTLYTEFNKPTEPYENDDVSLMSNAVASVSRKDILT